MTRPRTAHGARPATTVGEALRAAAHKAPDAVAVVDGDRRISYAELEGRANALARHLTTSGVRPADVVTVQLPNWWETVVLVHAVSLIGAVLNPVVSIYRRHEVEFIVAQARSRVLVVPRVHRGHDFRAMAHDIAASVDHDVTVIAVRSDAEVPPGLDLSRSPNTAALQPPDSPDDHDVDAAGYLLYTSGSTANPKGALHSARTLSHEARQVADIARLTSSDRVFMPSPLTHVTGLAFGAILPVELGIAVVLQDRWDPDLGVELVEEHACTFTVSATTFLAGMTRVHEKQDRNSSLEVFICGGAEIGPELVQRAGRAMGTRVVRCYGSTELPTFSVGDPFGELQVEARNDGHPVVGAQWLVETENGRATVGEGEILIRGSEMFLGYLDAQLNAEAFTDDGYFRTGDLVRVATDETCTVIGRVKDIIIRGGENLSAIEIEDQLQLHPAIEDVAVVAMPDEVLGERACAYAVLAPDSTLSLEEIRTFLDAAGMAIQKTPERLEIVEALPRTASGKVQKFVLRQRIAAAVQGGSP